MSTWPLNYREEYCVCLTFHFWVLQTKHQISVLPSIKNTVKDRTQPSMHFLWKFLWKMYDLELWPTDRVWCVSHRPYMNDKIINMTSNINVFYLFNIICILDIWTTELGLGRKGIHIYVRLCILHPLITKLWTDNDHQYLLCNIIFEDSLCT